MSGHVVAFAQNTRDEVREISGNIAGALSSQPGMKQQTYVAIDYANGTFAESDHALSLTTSQDRSRAAPVVAIGFQSSQSGFREVETHARLDSNNGSRRHNGVATQQGVRRLMPIECERLQGFPDNWIAGSDSARYRMLGNAVSVPVIEWIARRIKENT